MELTAVSNLATQLMEKHGLLAKGWYFAFDTSLRRFGCCWYSKKRIQVSRALAEANEEKDVRDVILHEIAHALCNPKAHHGPVWKAMARAIGAKPERCYETSEVFTVKYKWISVCRKCGITDTLIRRTNPSNDYRACPCWKARDVTKSFNIGEYRLRYKKVEKVVIPPTSKRPEPAPAPMILPTPIKYAIVNVRTMLVPDNLPVRKQFDAAECVRLYKAGTKVVDIAAGFGYPRGSGQNRVRNALIKAGVYKAVPVDFSTEK